MYSISYHVHQEPHLGVPQRPSCTSGASHGCTAEAMMYFIQEPHLLCTAYAIKCTVETIMYSTSRAPLRCTAFVIKCTAYPIMFIRSLAWVYCICNQVWTASYHVHQEPHLGVLHLLTGALDLPLSVLQRPSCTSGASHGCTAYASHTGVYYISHQVYCRGHGVPQEPHLGVLHLPSSVRHILWCKSGASLGILYFPHRCTAYTIMYIRSLTWVY